MIKCKLFRGQNTSPFLLLLILGIILGCGKGGISDGHEYFLNVYGLQIKDPTKLPEQTVVGKSVNHKGEPVPFAKVFVHGSPVYTTTNEKGGFLIGNLPKGRQRLYILASSGIGRTLDLDNPEHAFLEINSIELESLQTLYGQVKSGSAPVPDTRLSIDGSPFSTVSDSEGNYMMEVPRGAYRLMANHMLYKPVAREGLELTSKSHFGVNLEPLGFPEVEIRIVGSEGHIVRGLTTRLKIQRSKDVRFMRTLYDSMINDPENKNNSSWVDFQQEIVLEQKRPGFRALSLQFMDVFGKVTDPINVRFYNTLYDQSWRIITESPQGPIDINRGEKVALIGQAEKWSRLVLRSLSLADSDVETSTSEASRGTDTRTDATSSAAQTGALVFNFPVQIEAGATIHGSALFKQTVDFKGSQAAPIYWDTRDERGEQGFLTIQDPSSKINFTRFYGGLLFFQVGSSIPKWEPKSVPAWSLKEIVFQDMKIYLSGDFSWIAEANRFISSLLVIDYGPQLPKTIPSNTPASPIDPAPGALLPIGSIAIFKSEWIQSQINFERSGKVGLLKFVKNNVLRQDPDNYWLNMPKDNALPTDYLSTDFQHNFFEDQSGIVKNYKDWEPFFKNPAQLPNPEAGASFP